MTNPLRLQFLGALVCLSLVACASTRPIQTDDIPLTAVTPAEASSRFSDEDIKAGSQVLWGGVIVSSSNLQDVTQLEILAYPLNTRQRPRQSEPAEGRFLILVDGYLETVDYAAGRLLTVLGRLEGITEGRVGESLYPFPTVRSGQLHLWNEAAEERGSGFSFGLGISL